MIPNISFNGQTFNEEEAKKTSLKEKIAKAEKAFKEAEEAEQKAIAARTEAFAKLEELRAEAKAALVELEEPAAAESTGETATPTTTPSMGEQLDSASKP